MAFSQSCAANFVPFLARLVLGAVFITAGANKLGQTDYTGEDLRKLREMGVLAAGPSVMLYRASYSPQDPAGGGSGQSIGGGQDEGGTQTPPTTPPTVPPTGGGTDAGAQQGGGEAGTGQAPTPPAGETVRSYKLYGIATMLKGTPGEPYAKYLAWAATIAELVGGAMVLVGLFARFWALSLVGVMGVAFYLTSWPMLTEAGFNIFALASSPEKGVQNAIMYLQLSLLVMSLGIVVTGPGAASLDRFLFKGGDEGAEAES